MGGMRNSQLRIALIGLLGLAGTLLLPARPARAASPVWDLVPTPQGMTSGDRKVASTWEPPRSSLAGYPFTGIQACLWRVRPAPDIRIQCATARGSRMQVEFTGLTNASTLVKAGQQPHRYEVRARAVFHTSTFGPDEELPYVSRWVRNYGKAIPFRCTLPSVPGVSWSSPTPNMTELVNGLPPEARERMFRQAPTSLEGQVQAADNMVPEDLETGLIATVKEPDGEVRFVAVADDDPQPVATIQAELEPGDQVVSVTPDIAVRSATLPAGGYGDWWDRNPVDELDHYGAWGWHATGLAQSIRRNRQFAATSPLFAVLDTGSWIHHWMESYPPDPAKARWMSNPDARSRMIQGCPFASSFSGGQDFHGHGTHVAGILSGTWHRHRFSTVGAAPFATGYAVKVLDDGGSGTLLGVARGIIWAVANGAKVLNLSLIASPLDNRGQWIPGWAEIFAPLFTALEYAQSNGALVVAAAGNYAHRFNDPGYPGYYPGVLTVGAMELRDRPAAGSGYSPPVYHDRTGQFLGHMAPAPYSSAHARVDVAAPGSSIVAPCVKPDPTYTFPGILKPFCLFSGTSMSTPAVAGLAVRIWSLYPHLTAQEVRNRIVARTVDVGPPGWDPKTGHGVIRW